MKGIDLVYHIELRENVYNIYEIHEEYRSYDLLLQGEMQLSSNFKAYKELIIFVENDRRYALNATKSEDTFGWKTDEDFNSGIVNTIECYSGKYND